MASCAAELSSPAGRAAGPRTSPLLLYLDHLVHIPRYRVVGWALTAGPVILVATMSGSSLAVTTGIAAGVILLGTAAAGFHDLAGLRPALQPGPARLSTKAR